MPEAHHFKWWLWICNIENARDIGRGIVAATLENQQAQCVQLLLTRSDNTEARLELRHYSHKRYTAKMFSRTPGHATEQTKDESATQQRAASSSGHATEQLLQAPSRPVPTPEPTMPEDVASSSSAAPPQSLGKPCPQSTRLLEEGKVTEAEGLVNQAYMTRGYELEAIRQEAEQSWNKSLGLLGGAEEPLIQELGPTVDQSACWHLPRVPGPVSHEWDKQHVASSSGYATEQPVQARPTQACPQKDAMDAMDAMD